MNTQTQKQPIDTILLLPEAPLELSAGDYADTIRRLNQRFEPYIFPLSDSDERDAQNNIEQQVHELYLDSTQPSYKNISWQFSLAPAYMKKNPLEFTDFPTISPSHSQNVAGNPAGLVKIAGELFRGYKSAAYQSSIDSLNIFENADEFITFWSLHLDARRISAQALGTEYALRNKQKLITKIYTGLDSIGLGSEFSDLKKNAALLTNYNDKQHAKEIIHLHNVADQKYDTLFAA